LEIPFEANSERRITESPASETSALVNFKFGLSPHQVVPSFLLGLLARGGGFPPIAGEFDRDMA